MKAGHTTGRIVFVLLALFLVASACQPDLQPVDFSAPDTAVRGEAVGDRVHLTITNAGASAASNFSVGFYLSEDPVITTSDLLLTSGREWVGTIAAGQTIEVDLAGEASIPEDAPTGDMYIGALLDEANAVEERNETNNYVSRPMMLRSLDWSIAASTYLGGSGEDRIFGLAVAEDGVYVVGETSSEDLPGLNGYDTSFGGGCDAFVAKLDPLMSTVLAATYLGDSHWDHGYCIALHPDGSVYVGGETNGGALPVTADAADATREGAEGFIARFSSDLTSVLSCTYLGGSSGDQVLAMIVESEGLYVTGGTRSDDFPGLNGYDTTFGGSSPYSDPDAYVASLSADLTQIRNATYLGGQGYDMGFTIVRDTEEDIWIAGHTTSEDYPTIEGAYDRELGGNEDGFVSRLDATLSVLKASTFLGGPQYLIHSLNESAYGLAQGATGGIFVAGYTQDEEFPHTPGSYSQVGDCFVCRLNRDLTTLEASTGIPGVSLYDIQVDELGRLLVAGEYYGVSYSDAYVGRLDPELTSLDRSFIWGGLLYENMYYTYGNYFGSRLLELDDDGTLLVVGITESEDFPTTPGSVAPDAPAGWNGFLTRIVFWSCTNDGD